MSDQIQSNKRLVQRIFDEMWNAADPGAARTIFTHPEGVEKFVVDFLSAFPDLKHTIIETIAEDERVAVRFMAKGTHLGRWKDYPASGNPIHYSGLTLAHIANGKIDEHHTWWDINEVIAQITLHAA